MALYRNHEGYSDPTAGAALAGCRRKEKSDRRKAARKANAAARKRVAAESRTVSNDTEGLREIKGHGNGGNNESI